MREIGKLYRLEGQLIRSGRGYCLRCEPEGAIWNLTLQDGVSNLLDRIVCVEGIKSATKTIDVYWIAEADR